MIIELPVVPHDRTSKQYRMVFFHFSNNNLSIRRDCAIEVGKYDPQMATSEDVEICFRVALSDRWVACREPGVVVRHKARRTLGGMVRQLWGWGINLGRAYRKTGLRGLYLYWVSASRNAVVWDLEQVNFPILVTGFLTNFHVAHALGGVAIVLGLAGQEPAALGLGLVAVVLLGTWMRNVAGHGLGVWGTLKLAAVAYLANVTFMCAAFLGSLRAGMVYVPPAMLPPNAPSERHFYEGDGTPWPAAQGVRATEAGAMTAGTRSSSP